MISFVIEQYDALILYFEKECKTDKVDGARKIFDTLTNCGTKHILLFLQYILQKVNAINTEFQSEHFRLHQLYTMITSEYKSFLNCFIKEEILLAKKLSEIDPQDIGNKNLLVMYSYNLEDNAFLSYSMTHCKMRVAPLDSKMIASSFC